MISNSARSNNSSYSFDLNAVIVEHSSRSPVPGTAFENIQMGPKTLEKIGNNVMSNGNICFPYNLIQSSGNERIQNKYLT
jgi:hypothetical protein